MGGYSFDMKGLKDLLGQAPTKTPGLADQAQQLARQGQVESELAKRGRKSTMLTPLEAAMAPPTVGTKSILGS